MFEIRRKKSVILRSSRSKAYGIDRFQHSCFIII